MKYFNAASRIAFPAYTKSLTKMGMVIVILIDLIIITLLIVSSKKFHIEFMQWLPFIIVLLLAPFFSMLSFKIFRRPMREYDVEISDEGVFHKKPGKEVKFNWDQLTKRSNDYSFYGLESIRVHWEDASYTFHPWLVSEEDSKTRRLIKVKFYEEEYRQILSYGFHFSFAWIFKDGSKKALDVENSTGYKLLKQYRPDLF